MDKKWNPAYNYHSLITFKLCIYKSFFLLVFIYIHVRKRVRTHMQNLKEIFQNGNEGYLWLGSLQKLILFLYFLYFLF